MQETATPIRDPRAREAAGVIRQRIEAGIYESQLPGMGLLAAELGLNERTVMRGIAQLEAEGLVAGHSKRIAAASRLIFPQIRLSFVAKRPHQIHLHSTSLARRIIPVFTLLVAQMRFFGFTFAQRQVTSSKSSCWAY